MLFHIDNNLIFSFSPSNISSSSLSLKSLYSLDFSLIAFLNRPELELALPGEPAAMLEFCFGVFLGLYPRACLSPMNHDTVHRKTKQQQAARSRSDRGLLPAGAVRAATRPGGGDTLGISGWGCAAGTLEPFTYTRASSAEFCYPSYPRVAVSLV